MTKTKEYMMRKSIVAIGLALGAAFYACSPDEKKLAGTSPDVPSKNDGYCQLVVENDGVTRAEIRAKDNDDLKYYATIGDSTRGAPAFKVITMARPKVGEANLSCPGFSREFSVSAGRLRLENATPEDSGSAYCNLNGDRYTVVFGSIQSPSPDNS